MGDSWGILVDSWRFSWDSRGFLGILGGAYGIPGVSGVSGGFVRDSWGILGKNFVGRRKWLKRYVNEGWI